MSIAKPIHKHDCNHCIFLGNYANGDCYICKDGEEILSTLIYRRSSDGPDYSSGLEFVFSNIGLNKALSMADAQGHITGKLRARLLGLQASFFEYLKHDKDYALGIEKKWGDIKRYLINN